MLIFISFLGYYNLNSINVKFMNYKYRASYKENFLFLSLIKYIDIFYNTLYKYITFSLLRQNNLYSHFLCKFYHCSDLILLLSLLLHSAFHLHTRDFLIFIIL